MGDRQRGVLYWISRAFRLLQSVVEWLCRLGCCLKHMSICRRFPCPVGSVWAALPSRI